MTIYEIEFASSVKKDLRKLAKSDQARVLAAIQKLAQSPRTGDTRPMKGVDAWRLRVGAYRVVYDIHDGKLKILVLKVAHRKNVYK